MSFPVSSQTQTRVDNIYLLNLQCIVPLTCGHSEIAEPLVLLSILQSVFVISRFLQLSLVGSLQGILICVKIPASSIIDDAGIFTQ